MTRAACIVCVACLTAACSSAPADGTWPDGYSVVRGAAPVGYVTNNGSDSLSVVELGSMRLLARVPVGVSPIEKEGPHHLAIDLEAGFVYVGLSNVVPMPVPGPHGSHGTGTVDGYVQRLRLETLAPDGVVRVDTNLGDVVLSPDATRIFTTHFDRTRAVRVAMARGTVREAYANLDAIDAVTLTRTAKVPLCVAPHGIAVVGSTAIVACYGEDAVALVDLAPSPPVVRARVPVRGGIAALAPTDPYAATTLEGPYSVALAPGGAAAFVGCLEGKAVRVLDLATSAMDPARTVELPGGAYFGSFSADGSRYFVATQARDGVSVIDVASHSVVRERALDAATCLAPHEAVLVESLARVFVVCEGDHRGNGAVLALDAETLETRGRVEVEVFPDALRVLDEVAW